jgi:ribonuclease VapC
MVIDSSALVALLLGEPETATFVAAIAAAPRRLMSTASYLETAIVMTSRIGSSGLEKLNGLLNGLSIELTPFSPDQAVLAVAAHRAYGRGSGHPAALNFGDCFSYALAKHLDEPLLFKGGDFSLTDIIPVIQAPS